MSDLTANDILPGHTYRAKRPYRVVGGGFNDRTVTWVNDQQTRVQYDSPVVKMGQHFPVVSMDHFLKWAGKEVSAPENVKTSELRGWQCRCGRLHLEQEAALACCPPRPTHVFRCEACKALHEAFTDARDCCSRSEEIDDERIPETTSNRGR